MKRNIIKINEEKCNGCGLCVTACHEGAIEIIDGKAKLIHDRYCDGLGNCLPACPTDAIKIIEREADEFDEEAVKELLKEKAEKEKIQEKAKPMACGCPGMMARKIEKSAKKEEEMPKHVELNGDLKRSELAQWPVQIKLVNPQADYLNNADILIAADCTAYAYGNFHNDFIKGKIVLIGCPKLDDNNYYIEKLTEIFSKNEIKSITVVRMEVPCCGGIISAAREAMLRSKTIVPYNEVIIGVDGEIV